MTKRSPRTAPAAAETPAEAAPAPAPAPAPKRRRAAKAAAPAAPAAEPDGVETFEIARPEAEPDLMAAFAAAEFEPEAEAAGIEAPADEAPTDEAPIDEAYAGLPPEIAAMLAAAAAEAAADAGGVPEGAERLALPPVLDLTASADLRQALLARRGTPLVLDAAAVERLGGQCLQVLLSARATWAADGQALALDGPSEPLLRDLAILGVSPESLSTHETA